MNGNPNKTEHDIAVADFFAINSITYSQGILWWQKGIKFYRE